MLLADLIKSTANSPPIHNATYTLFGLRDSHFYPPDYLTPGQRYTPYIEAQVALTCYIEQVFNMRAGAHYHHVSLCYINGLADITLSGAVTL